MHKSYKDCYPFRLATTSFIYPASYATNVRRLAPWVDEIELLLFERDHLPEKSEILELRKLASALDLTYNIHLPMDISLGATQAGRRSASVAAICQTLERVAPLAATTHTLHLTFDEPRQPRASVVDWQDRCMDSLQDLLRKSTLPSRQLSVETLDFNPQWLAKIVELMDLSVCIDIGHLIRYGYDLENVLALYEMRTAIFHLHGVVDGKDHQPLTWLKAEALDIMARKLMGYRGSVSLEVFSHQHFVDSLESLAKLLPQAMLQRTAGGDNE